MKKWRVLRGPELLGVIELPEDPDKELVLQKIEQYHIEIDRDDTSVKVGKNIIYVTGKRKHVMIDLMRE